MWWVLGLYGLIGFGLWWPRAVEASQDEWDHGEDVVYNLSVVFMGCLVTMPVFVAAWPGWLLWRVTR